MLIGMGCIERKGNSVLSCVTGIVTMHPILAPLLAGREEKYPRTLETRHLRVFNNIMDQWGKPELDDYFNELFIDRRGGRQGFPVEVMQDIFFLYSLWKKVKGDKPSQDAVWSNEAVKRGLEKEEIEYSPRGFFRAVETGNENAIRLFLQAGVDLELTNEAGWTPLLVSLFMASETTAILLVNAGAKVTACNKHGYGPLHWAAYQGFTQAIQVLIQKGAYVNVRSDRGLTPLLQAAARGHAEVVRLLLSKRALVNDPDEEGWTPLHKAVANGHLEVVRLLMAAHADPHAHHASGATPVSIAQQKKNPEIIQAVCG